MQTTPVRGEPDKLAIEACKTGFDETYLPSRVGQAQREVLRCLKCGEHSVCKWTYPLHNHVPQWIEPVKVGNIGTVVELSHQTNTLPEITGRVCPQDRLCEDIYTIHDEHGAVTIGNIERYASDQALAKGWHPDLSHITEMGKRVAIIGAGPAGLTCADVLARNGVVVTMYDRHPEIDDLLTFGIPSFKLDKSLLACRREIFSAMGIHLELNCGVGKDVSLDSLLEQYNAVLVGAGTYHSMKVGLPDEDTPGVYDALSFLTASTKQMVGLEGLSEEPFINTAGLNVVVLGDGDTATDCVRTTLRYGAGNVTCTYRRDEANMPGSKKEVKDAHEGGANFEFNVQPVALELSERGHVCGIRFLYTCLGESDAQRRRRFAPVEDSEFVIPADMMIMAFGFNLHGVPWLESRGVAIDKRGRTVTDMESQYRYQTTNPEIFAGGDAVRGMDLMVTTTTEGCHMAQGVTD